MSEIRGSRIISVSCGFCWQSLGIAGLRGGITPISTLSPCCCPLAAPVSLCLYLSGCIPPAVPVSLRLRLYPCARIPPAVPVSLCLRAVFSQGHPSLGAGPTYSNMILALLRHICRDLDPNKATYTGARG